MHSTLIRDKAFFDLFMDFKGYVDFFFLQDAVKDDYSGVKIWCENTDFYDSGLPKSIDEYSRFIDGEFDFLPKRNDRIREWTLEEMKSDSLE